jgi:hypothetical protein
VAQSREQLLILGVVQTLQTIGQIVMILNVKYKFQDHVLVPFQMAAIVLITATLTKTDGPCSGAPAEAKTSSSVDAVCYNVTPVAATDKCTTGYTFNTTTTFYEKKDQKLLMYY